MYLDFFKLKKKPFENTNDGTFFFESDSHKEAYSRIKYVIEDRQSCAMLSGGYGTGKTFILKTIEKELSRKGYLFSFVANPSVDETGILKLIAHNYISYRIGETKADLLISLEKFFKDTHRDAKHCVVVIDEAQNINSDGVLEELRMLLNYQIENRNLLTLIISGQSELIEKISSNKQFMQRIFLSYEIKPLSKKETKEYVFHRMSVAGAEPQIFSEDCFESLYERSGGIPRWINNICSIALLTAFSKGMSVIDGDIIKESYESIRGSE
ncbi:MAG: AAA family ATPase [Elusimicrobiota bacterium]